MTTERPDLSQRRTRVAVTTAPDLGVDPIDLPIAPQATQPVAPLTPPTAKPVKGVRITTDITQETYRALTAFSNELAVTLGRPKIAHTAVIRALLAKLEEDPEFRIAISAKIAAEQRNSANQ